MPGVTNYWEGQILNWMVSTTSWVALSKDAPTETGTGFTEPVGNGYLRVTTTAGTWGTATVGAPSTLLNVATIAFPTATGDWSSGSTFPYAMIFNNATATVSTFLMQFGSITTPKAVLSGDTPSFAASAITLQVGDPTDSY